MKFYDIAIGTRFQFEGIEYIKSSPVLATSKDGQQRLIRRSAILQPIDVTPPGRKQANALQNVLDREKTLHAFDDFYATCIKLTGRSTELESARQTFLDALNQDGAIQTQSGQAPS